MTSESLAREVGGGDIPRDFPLSTCMRSSSGEGEWTTRVPADVGDSVVMGGRVTGVALGTGATTADGGGGRGSVDGMPVVGGLRSSMRASGECDG